MGHVAEFAGCDAAVQLSRVNWAWHNSLMESLVWRQYISNNESASNAMRKPYSFAEAAKGRRPLGLELELRRVLLDAWKSFLNPTKAVRRDSAIASRLSPQDLSPSLQKMHRMIHESRSEREVKESKSLFEYLLTLSNPHLPYSSIEAIISSPPVPVSPSPTLSSPSSSPSQTVETSPLPLTPAHSQFHLRAQRNSSSQTTDLGHVPNSLYRLLQPFVRGSCKCLKSKMLAWCDHKGSFFNRSVKIKLNTHLELREWKSMTVLEQEIYKFNPRTMVRLRSSQLLQRSAALKQGSHCSSSIRGPSSRPSPPSVLSTCGNDRPQNSRTTDHPASSSETRELVLLFRTTEDVNDLKWSTLTKLRELYRFRVKQPQKWVATLHLSSWDLLEELGVIFIDNPSKQTSQIVLTSVLTTLLSPTIPRTRIRNPL